MRTAPGDLERQGDEDWFSTTLVAGRQYTFDVVADQPDAGAPLGLGVYDSSRAQVTQGDTDLTFTPQTSGEYFLAVSSTAASGGSGDVLSTNPARAISDSWYQPENRRDDLAFDNNTATCWATSTSGADSSGVAWLGYDFGAGGEKAVGPSPSRITPAGTPRLGSGSSTAPTARPGSIRRALEQRGLVKRTAAAQNPPDEDGQPSPPPGQPQTPNSLSVRFFRPERPVVDPDQAPMNSGVRFWAPASTPSRKSLV
jgi:hypothetical protein